MPYGDVMDGIGKLIDAVGVSVVVVGAAMASVRCLRAQRRGSTREYVNFRQALGRAILLGLELLIAGDIIRTVVLAPTLANVAILGLIVLIRTFLSVALQLEIERRWPWQRDEEGARPETTSIAGVTRVSG